MRIIEEPIRKDELARLSRNFSPAQNNRSRYVENAGMRDKIKTVVAKWLK